MMLTSKAFSRFRRPAATLSPLSFCFLLRVLAYPNHPFIMALHAVDSVAGLGEDELVNAILTHLALEAVGVV
jgi:multisubunit Na+/H+ antiporter MnhB subunit